MSVSVIKSTEPKNANIFTVSAAGASAGAAVRHFLPVSKFETDSVLFGEADKIRANNIKHARKTALGEISRMLGKNSDNKALQLLKERTKASVKYANALESGNKKAQKEAVELAKAAKEKIKAAPEAVKKEISQLTAKLINNVRAARFLSEGTIKNAVKQQRPYAAFILPGIALGALGAFVYNVVGAISRD